MTESIVVLVLLVVLFPAVYVLFDRARKREEKRLTPQNDLKIKNTKLIAGIMIGFTCVIIAAMIGVVVGYLLDDSMPKNIFFLIEGILLFFALLGALGVCAARGEYIIVAGEEIFIKRLFCKVKKVSFREIAFFSMHPVALGGIVCYDKAGVAMFTVPQMMVGVEAFASLLAQRQIEFLPVPFPEERFRQLPRYNLYKKKQKAMSVFASFAVCAACFLFLALLILPLLSRWEFYNLPAEGYVEEFEIDEDTITLHLQGDERVYWLSNIVYPKLDKTFLDKLEKGIYVHLQIAHTDSRDRQVLSGIEYYGREYLTPQDAQDAEYANYRFGRVLAFVFLGLGCVLSVFSVWAWVRWRRCVAVYKASEWAEGAK